jgi:hypothetical protein
MLCKLIAWGWCQQGKVNKKVIHLESNLKWFKKKWTQESRWTKISWNINIKT